MLILLRRWCRRLRRSSRASTPFAVDGSGRARAACMRGRSRCELPERLRAPGLDPRGVRPRCRPAKNVDRRDDDAVRACQLGCDKEGTDAVEAVVTTVDGVRRIFQESTDLGRRHVGRIGEHQRERAVGFVEVFDAHAAHFGLHVVGGGVATGPFACRRVVVDLDQRSSRPVRPRPGRCGRRRSAARAMGSVGHPVGERGRVVRSARSSTVGVPAPSRRTPRGADRSRTTARSSHAQRRSCAAALASIPKRSAMTAKNRWFTSSRHLAPRTRPSAHAGDGGRQAGRSHRSSQSLP